MVIFILIFSFLCASQPIAILAATVPVSEYSHLCEASAGA